MAGRTLPLVLVVVYQSRSTPSRVCGDHTKIRRAVPRSLPECLHALRRADSGGVLRHSALRQLCQRKASWPENLIVHVRKILICLECPTLEHVTGAQRQRTVSASPSPSIGVYLGGLIAFLTGSHLLWIA